MAENFFIDGPGLQGDAERLRTTGHTLGAAFTKLTGVLDDHYECWGTDDIGKSFATNYVDPEKKFRENGKLVVDGTTTLADDIDTSREVFTSVDADNARRIDETSTKT